MRAAVTILALIGALIMVVAGVTKVALTGFRNDMNDLYEIAGSDLGPWFYLAVGVVEIVVAVALIPPPTRIFGGLGLLIVQLGAAGFNNFLTVDPLPDDAGDPATFLIVNLVLAGLGLVIALGWRIFGRPIPAASPATV